VALQHAVERIYESSRLRCELNRRACQVGFVRGVFSIYTCHATSRKELGSTLGKPNARARDDDHPHALEPALLQVLINCPTTRVRADKSKFELGIP